MYEGIIHDWQIILAYVSSENYEDHHFPWIPWQPGPAENWSLGVDCLHFGYLWLRHHSHQPHHMGSPLENAWFRTKKAQMREKKSCVWPNPFHKVSFLQELDAFLQLVFPILNVKRLDSTGNQRAYLFEDTHDSYLVLDTWSYLSVEKYFHPWMKSLQL